MDLPDKKTPLDPVRETLERRSLLEWLGTGVVVSLASPLLGCLGDASPPTAGPGDAPTRPPGGDDDPGAGWPGGDSTDTFPFAPSPRAGVLTDFVEYTVDPQRVADILATWQLTVDGLVDNPRTFAFAELIDLPRIDLDVDFHCVTGWSVFDVPWNGVHLDLLLNETGVDATASHVTFHTLGGIYNESLPLSLAREPKTVLAYGVADSTLPLAHGFPLRLVVPRLQGYKSAKYVVRVEVTDRPVNGYWEQRGYSYDALVPESRLRDGKF